MPVVLLPSGALAPLEEPGLTVLLASRGELSDDPLDFAARDPQTWLIGALSGAVLILGSIL